jgi:hypothetical protein
MDQLTEPGVDQFTETGMTGHRVLGVESDLILVTEVPL